MKKESTLKCAVVGCGRIAGSIDDEQTKDINVPGPYCHAGGYAAVNETTIIAAADINKTQLNAFCKRWEVPNGYEDYREMIEKEKPDILSICTGQKLHAPIAIFAAEHGVKGIYCEKAMCSSLQEADAMVDAIEKNGVTFNLGVSRRFTGYFEKAKEMIADGLLGDIKWYQFTGNDQLMHGYSHAFDLICYLAGDPPAKWLSGQIAPYSSATTPPQKCTYNPDVNKWDRDPGGHWAIVEFEGGSMVQMANASGMPMYEWQVVGTKGILHFTDYGKKPVWRKGKGYDKIEVSFPEFKRHSPTVKLIENMIHCMKTGETTVSNEKVSRAVTELCIANAESHLNGAAPVKLPLQNRTLYIPGH